MINRDSGDVPPRPIPPPPVYVVEAVHEDLFDWVRLRRYLAFSLQSIARRRWLFIGVVVSMVGLAAAALAVLPRTYQVECKLLARKNAVLAVRADANQADQPARAAAETIVRRENLHALIGQTGLLKEWPRRRAPILRLKDRVLAGLGMAQSEKDLLDGLTGLLEKNLNVWATPDGAVTIQLSWPDGVMAYRLVDAAEQNFLETRHVLDISTIAEQISILEGHAAELKKDIDKQVDDLQAARQRSAPRGARLPPRAPMPKPVDPEVVNLKVMLEAKRRAIADLEDARRRHLVELQTRMAEQRAVYAPNHPVMVDLEESIESLRRESPQLAALRQEEAELRGQLARHPDSGEPGQAQALSIPPDLFRSDLASEDSAVEYARAQLRFSVQSYASMRERIQAARIDLDTARAAFKYRYSVVVPPEVPRGPIKPKPTLVMLAAIVAGLLLAVFATTVADLRSGVVLEVWQVQDVVGTDRPIIDLRGAALLPPGKPSS